MNILSIDIDVFFNGHTIQKYMNYETEPEDSWNMIAYLEKTNKYNIDTKLDTKALGIVCEVLNKKANKSKVRVIEEHNEIINIMEELNIKGANVYNFDDHHDINYGNDNRSLNIENWVLHGKSKQIINNYYWICRPLSDIRCDSPIMYNRDCIYDLDISLLPDFDLVVLCTSHHFTPRKYWYKLTNVLLSYCNQDLKYFREIHSMSIPDNLFNNVDDYLLDGTLPEVNRIFRYNDCYIIFEKDDNSLSIINKGKGFGISVCKEVVDLIIREYGYCSFTWDINIRNNILIERLIKNYTILNDDICICNNKQIKTIKIKEAL